MKSVQIGRVMLATDVGDIPGEYSLLVLNIFSKDEEAGLRISLLGHHVWLILLRGKQVINERYSP